MATHVDKDTARVEVAVEVSIGWPPNAAVIENHTFRLTRTPASHGQAARWHIAGTPWPLYSCGGGVK